MFSNQTSVKMYKRNNDLQTKWTATSEAKQTRGVHNDE